MQKLHLCSSTMDPMLAMLSMDRVELGRPLLSFLLLAAPTCPQKERSCKHLYRVKQLYLVILKSCSLLF